MFMNVYDKSRVVAVHNSREKADWADEGREACIEVDSNTLVAAPELLEALKAALRKLIEVQIATGYPTAYVQIEIETVITKAEGQNED